MRPYFAGYPGGIPPELRDVYAMMDECQKQIMAWHNTRMPRIYIAQDKVNQLNTAALENMTMRPRPSHYEYSNSNAVATEAPKRTGVTVDGIVLTRGQIERAYAELNKPLPPTFKTGDKVTFSGIVGFVLTGQMANMCAEAYPSLAKHPQTLWVATAEGTIYHWNALQVVKL